MKGDPMELKYPGVTFRDGYWRVRVRPFPERTFKTFEDAVEQAADYHKLKRQGIRHAGPRHVVETLAEACQAFIARKRVGGRRGPLTVNGLDHWQRNVDVWAATVTDRRGVPLGSYPLDRVPRDWGSSDAGR
jgi:hypothetical protein